MKHGIKEGNLLEVNGVKKNIAGLFLLDEISFTLRQGERLGIVGETGSGKSTLLKLIAGLEQSDSGNIFFEGKKVKGPNYQLIPGQPGIAYLSQHFELRNWYRVEELLDYANELSDVEAMTLYKLCQIDHLVKRRTDQLSGGEKQRVALARILVTRPRLLILDEPFSNTDLIQKNNLRQILENITASFGTDFIMTSHDPFDILSWADMLLVLKKGKVVQTGTPQDLYYAPLNAYVAGLFGTYNNVSVNLASQLGYNAPGSSAYLRPEQISIDDSLEAKVKGIITAVRFMGAFVELQVNVDGELIFIRTFRAGFQKGDRVGLSLRNNNC